MSTPYSLELFKLIASRHGVGELVKQHVEGDYSDTAFWMVLCETYCPISRFRSSPANPLTDLPLCPASPRYN